MGTKLGLFGFRIQKPGPAVFREKLNLTNIILDTVRTYMIVL